MNIALIIAGGTGNRMGADIPKQFLLINEKPVIIYTLETFQNHPLIDKICVVCVDGWHDALKKYTEHFGISKLQWICNGGKTSQESIRNGIEHLKSHTKDNDIVVIHDGVRPLIGIDVLNDVIVKCEQHGNAVTALPYNEQIFIKDDDFSTTKYIPREKLRRVSTPQAYKMSKLAWAYEKAFKENIGISASSYTNTMMVELGETLFFSLGSEKNIKLTTQDDLEIFKALLMVKNNA